MGDYGRFFHGKGKGLEQEYPLNRVTFGLVGSGEQQMFEPNILHAAKPTFAAVFSSMFLYIS